MEPISVLLQSPIFSKLSVAAIAIAFVTLFWWRAGSVSSVLEHLWRLAAGKAEVNDPELKKFIHETRDIEKFRFVYGLKVENIAELHKLLAWTKKHALGIARVQRARRWIDVKSMDIVCPPPRQYFIFRTITAVLCYLLVNTFTAWSSYPSAVLQTKVSKIWFLSDAKSVKPFFADWEIDAKRCAAGREEVQKISGFSETEVASICKALTDQSLQPIVDKTVHLQQAFSVVMAIVSFIWLISAIIRIISADAAKKIKKSIASAVTCEITSPMPAQPAQGKQRAPRKRKKNPVVIDQPALDSNGPSSSLNTPKEPV